MKHRAFFKIWVIIILIVIFAGGIFAWQYFETQEDKTVSWNTYRNEEYGFEVKYFDDWRVSQWGPPPGEPSPLVCISFFPASIDTYGGEVAVELKVYENREKHSIVEWLNKSQYLYTRIGNFQLDPVKEIKIGEKDGIKVMGTPHGYDEGYGCQLINIFFSREENIFSLSTCIGPTTKNAEELGDIFNKMLSTFKLLE